MGSEMCIRDSTYSKGIAKGMTQQVSREPAAPVRKELSSTEELEKELLKKGLL